MDQLFANGTYRGEGRWIDQKAEGRYKAQYQIENGPDDSKIHRVERIFLKADGSIAYEERSTVSFEPKERGSIWVRIQSSQGTVAGSGYAFEEHCHYDVDVTGDNHLEFTFHVENHKLRGLGSATNKGNHTYWEESLDRIS